MKKKVKKKSNSKKLGGIIFCCLFFLSLISGCSSIPEYHYYFLDYEIPYNKSNPKYTCSLGVERLQAEEIYKSDTIIFRNSPYEARHYIYKLWGSNPRALLFEKTLEHIKASGLFKSVRLYPGMYNADYILRGYIRKFEELDKADGWYADFSVEWELIDPKSGNVMLSARTDKMQKARNKTTLDVVKAMSVCVQEALNNLTAKIDQAVKTQTIKE